MGLYDLSFKVLFDDNSEEMVRLALGMGIEVEQVQMEPTETLILERKMDRLARVRAGGREFLLLPEFKVAYQADIDRQMFTYASRAMIVHHFLPVLPVVYYLTSEGYPRAAKRSFGWSVLGRPVGQMRFEEVRLFEWTAHRALESGNGVLLAMVPMLAGTEAERVIEASRQIETLQRPGPVRSNLQAVLVLLGQKAFPALDLESRIPKEMYMGSMIYENILEEGRQEGRADGLRTALRTSYEARLGPMPPELRRRLEQTRDPEQLGRWLPLVATGTAEEIAAGMTAPEG